MIGFKSLQHRLVILLLLPVAILLVAMGYLGLFYARNQLFDQWGEAAILKLQRAAHHVDMRLNRPKELLNIFHDIAGTPNAMRIQDTILNQLEKLDGVVRVDVTWMEDIPEAEKPERGFRGSMMGPWRESGPMMHPMMPFHRGRIVNITPPKYDRPTNQETVSLVSELKNKNGKTVGQIEVLIGFSYLVEAIQATGWWQARKAFLVDDEGRILTSNLSKERERLSENGDPLEKSTLESMNAVPFGTVFSPGFTPSEVSGFYRLMEAPWTLVLISAGKEVLAPILRFQVYFLVIGAAFIVIILLLIRLVSGTIVKAIRSASRAACKIATGDFSVCLPVNTQDEVGELNSSFNTMARQLEDRARLKNSLNLAKEVQQNLLPEKSLQLSCLDIVGMSLYCDETGGDYFDFLQFQELGRDRIGIAVGDVTGHGIAAALLMATARALIRSRIVQPGTLAETVTDVNRLLCMDTASSGNFLTLFLTLIDVGKRQISWVRAGHDPALVYDPAPDVFHELDGDGIALGVDEKRGYEQYTFDQWSQGQIILIGTDGIWESLNGQGEMFGKDRVRQIIRENRHESAQEILKAITENVARFRKGTAQQDDITLVIVKLK